MGGLLKVHIPLVVRRLVTLIPALVILGIGFDPHAGARAQPGGAELRHPVRADPTCCDRELEAADGPVRERGLAAGGRLG